jgi:murein DD-endopeptidase MepM/ murein hydrolase activator NlpD
VGWNAIGGWRFWLYDKYGNGFYHAHLSAYAPGAKDGLKVHAGDVIGFVGHTGDAQGTPNHLHFEIHPASTSIGPGLRRHDDAIDPHPFLMAWLGGTSVPGMGLSAGVGGVSPLTLISAVDVSTVSGLAPGRLEDALPAGQDASSNEPA